jgi:hypothetical protein
MGYGGPCLGRQNGANLIGQAANQKRVGPNILHLKSKKTHVHLPCTSQFTQWIQHELSVPGNPKIILYTSSTISLTSDSSWPASFHFAGEGEACKAAKRTASPTGWRQQQKQTENSVDQPKRRQQQKELDHAATQTATACYPCAMVLQIDLSNKGSRLTLPDISNII